MHTRAVDPSLTSAFAGFCAGVASSALVAIPVYVAQKRAAAASERRLILLIEQQLRVSNRMFSTMRVLSAANADLVKEFGALQGRLATAPRTRAISAVLDLAGEYSDVARSLAAQSAEALVETESLPTPITRATLFSLHERLFPPGYELAGRLRDSQVWIGGLGSTPETAEFVPPPPEQVPILLDYILEGWNGALPGLVSASHREQTQQIAFFHHRFVSLHPFLDGNGVIGRLLIALQAKHFTGHTPALVQTTAEYYAALRQADAGDFSPLGRLVMAALA